MNLLFWIVLSLSILCLLYYCLIIAFAGFGTTFSKIWIITGLAGICLSAFIRYMNVYKVELPYWLELLIILVVLLGLVVFVLIEGVLIYHSVQRYFPQMDYIIVLGAQVRGTIISKTLIKRLDTAFHYLQENPKTIAIVSGGKGKDEFLSEAEAMKQYLVDRGIAAARICLEDKSRNTVENILYSKPLIKDESKVAIVTNSFHMYRSIRIAKKQGLREVKALAAPTDRILSVNYYVREAVGVLKDMLLGNL